MKNIKTKPQTTTKSVKNAPKSVEHSAKQAAWDIKTVAKDTLVKNVMDKQFDTRQSEQPQRAEVEATEQVENTYYSAVDTVYHKSKSLAENKVKQHRQQVKAKENTNVPQNETVSDMPNTPKQAEHTPKTKESVQASAPENTQKVQNKPNAQVKTKETYIKSQKSQKAENTAETVKTKQNYINVHKNAEIKQKTRVSTPKTRENTSVSPTPKTKEQTIKDARKKYVSEKLKTKAEAEKSARENYATNIPKQNAEPVKPLSVDETAYSSKSMSKTKDDMISKYNFTRKQQEALNTLLEQDEVLISATQSLAISDATAQDILKNLPESLSAERKKVIKAACSLVGKVNYFWGGKSSAIGWDSEWGKLNTVSSEGSKTTGTKRPFGLDCSGFVTWSFINSGFSANAIGHGTQGQIAKCSRISWSNAQAGDLAFYGDLSHVGIIAGKDASGNILVIYRSASYNNVVITTNGGFGFAARPSAY